MTSTSGSWRLGGARTARQLTFTPGWLPWPRSPDRATTPLTLRRSREHSTIFGGAALGIQIRANQGHETYVAVRIIGSVPEALTVIVLDLVPGCDLDGWFPEYSLPERPLDAAEQAWSNLMNPVEAAKLLDEGGDPASHRP